MRLAVCSLLAGFLGVAAWAVAGDWPTFRGSDRLAWSQETGLLQSWPSGGPPLAWETAGAGRSYASLAIATAVRDGDGPRARDAAEEHVAELFGAVRSMVVEARRTR